MPVLANLPLTSRPGVTIVLLIGSSMLKPAPGRRSHATSRWRFRDPVVAAADALVDQLLRAPDLEPPVLAELLVDLAHRAAEVERLADAFLDQRRAAGRLHHRRRDVARGDDRVLRRGRGVHQVGLVEQVRGRACCVLRVLHQHLRGLADAGQQLVRRSAWRRPAHPSAAARACPSRGSCRRTGGTRRAAARLRRNAACRSSRRACP